VAGWKSLPQCQPRANLQEVEDSLRRLRTDHIDVYQVHWPDPLVTIEETAEAMHTLFEQGKIRAIGVSNFSVGQMERFVALRRCMCCSRPITCSSAASRPTFSPIAEERDLDLRLWRALPRPLVRADAAGQQFEGDDLRHGFEVQAAAFRRVSRCVHGSINSPATLPQRVIHLAIRWMLDQGITTALWGRAPSGQLEPVDEVSG